MIGRVYVDMKIASNIKINHIMVSFTDHYNAISIDKKLKTKIKIRKNSWKTKTKKLKLEKIHDTLIIRFYGSPSSPQWQSVLKIIQKRKFQTRN